MSVTLRRVVDQRKTVSVVFADLVESSSLAERLDPEVLAGVLGRYFSALRTVIEKHGGTVEKFIGDAVVGVFGVPVLHEDDALRAVKAALEIQAAVDKLNDDLAHSPGTALQVRVGVNTGEVVVSGENSLGHAISMAARLEQNADAGEVLIGRQTRDLVGESVDAVAIDDLAVKGSTDPLRAWRAVGLRAAPSSRSASAYVGRSPELAQLAAAFELAAATPACVTVTVVAPPGLGKSRLMAEAVGRIDERARVLVGRCMPYGESITYAPLIEAVRQLETSEGEDVLDRLLGELPDGQQVAGRVRATMAGAAHGSPDETAWAFRRLFNSLAAQKPLVVIVDDIHWADGVLLDLIEYVGTFSVASPILLLCAARPDLFETRPSWSAPRDNAQQLRLAPLTADETAGLLAGLDDKLDVGARKRIVETSGGVPLFVEQMAAFDAEVSGHTAIPPTVRALLAARVDRLTPAERTLLECAAIEGAAFRRDTLAELMPDDARGTLGSDLMSLIRRDFIRPEPGIGGHDTFGFNHALIRDAVYEAMPRRTRALLHERYAAILERRGDASQEVVGHHYEEAYRELSALGESGAPTQALAVRAGTALAAAGRDATARKQTSNAIGLLSAANDLLTGDPERRLELMPDLIDALVAEGDVDRARATRNDAIELSRALGDVRGELRAELAWGAIEPRRGDLGWQERTFALTERAVDHFAKTDDQVSIAKALVLKGLALAPHDQTAATDALKEAQGFAERSGDERIQVEVWDELGGAMLFGPTPYSETLVFTRREVEWAREHGIAFSVADGRLGEAYSLAALGDFDDALAALRELMDLFAQLPGRVSQHGECYTLAGGIERDRGNPAAAATLYRKAMDIFDQSGHRRWWRNAAPGVAHAYLDMGRAR